MTTPRPTVHTTSKGMPTAQEILDALVNLTNRMAEEDILKLNLDTVTAKFRADEIILRCFANSEMAGVA